MHRRQATGKCDVGGTTRKWATCLAIGVLGVVVACSEQPTEVTPALAFDAHANRDVSVAEASAFGDRKFEAWSYGFSDGYIRTQYSGLDARQFRQVVSSADASVLAFAQANPGRLYVDGDEPDQSCTSPSTYATNYHDFVAAIRAVDPTAKFSPAGFAEPNGYCCPPGADCSTMHSIAYASDFYDAYMQQYAVAPPVDEWRFHNFGLTVATGDVTAWWAQVSNMAQWSIDHGAHMVLGSFGFLWWNEPTATFQNHMTQAMRLIYDDSRINQAVWWSYENTGQPHFLMNTNGGYTPEGLTFADAQDGSTLAADIVGATEVNYSPDCRLRYQVIPSGGTGSYSYAWSTDGVIKEDYGDVIYAAFPTGTPYGDVRDVYVTVTDDGNGDTVTANLHINTGPEWDWCYDD